MSYLLRFSKSYTDECQLCGNLDTMEYVMFECEAVVGAKKALIYLVELRDQQWPYGFYFLVDSPELCEEFRGVYE